MCYAVSMIIENIKLKSSRNANIFVMTVDDEDYIVHSDVIVKYHLTKSEELTIDILQEVITESEQIICLEHVNKYLSSRLKTSKQLKEYLLKQGYSLQTINYALNKLKEYGIINDENYAKMFVESNQHKLSKRGLENKLLSRGIKKDAIDENLAEIDDKELCFSMAKKFLKNKELSQDNLNKLMRHLQYKGFSYDSIYTTLDKIKLEQNY